MNNSQIGSVFTALGMLTLAFSVRGFAGCSSSGSTETGPGFGGSIEQGGATNTDTEAGAGGASGVSSDDERGGDGGDGGDGGSMELAPSCQPGKGADVPDDDFLDSNCDGIDGDARRAIFVSPSGSDAADGTRSKPLKTIQHGVELAQAAKKDVYVCLGEYTDNIVVGKDAVSVFGGYDCSDWSRSNGRVKVAPLSGSALVVRGAPAPVVVDRFELRSADATHAGESSIAAMIVNSEAVTLSNVTVSAGAGATGKPGGAVKPVTSAATTGVSGQDAGSQCNYIDGAVLPSPACQRLRTGGAKGAVTCANGDHVRGGMGGTGGNKTYPNIVLPTSGGTGLPGGKSVNQSRKPGEIGSPGVPASAGFGAVTADGYLPTNIGGEGDIGHAGESGGGGGGGDACYYYDDTLADCQTSNWNGATLFMGAGGGQGGFGGCGGVGGKGGQGGGASIALFSYGSKLTISLSSLTSSSGGRGGGPTAGAAGQPGGAAGTGGSPSPHNHSSTTPAIEEGQDGANGATGGPGGPGGAGGGGPSIVVLAALNAPRIMGTTLSAGSGGPGGIGIEKQDGAPGESYETKLIDIVDDGAAGAGSQ